MMLFTFFALMLLLVAECLYIRKKTLIPVVFCGAFLAALVCAFRTFFIFAHRVVPYSFAENFGFFFVRQILLPILILYGLFFLLSRDSIEFKVEMFLPLMTAFYMLYLPYTIVSSAEGLYSAFGLFVKPVMFIAMLLQLTVCVNGIKRSVENKKIVFTVLYALCLIVYLIIPAMVEAMYMVNTNLAVALFSALLYCVLPGLFVTLKVMRICA